MLLPPHAASLSLQQKSQNLHQKIKGAVHTKLQDILQCACGLAVLAMAKHRSRHFIFASHLVSESCLHCCAAANVSKSWCTSASAAAEMSCRTKSTQAGSMSVFKAYLISAACIVACIMHSWSMPLPTLGLIIQVNLSLMAVTDLMHLAKKLTKGVSSLRTLKLECFPKYAFQVY